MSKKTEIAKIFQHVDPAVHCTANCCICGNGIEDDYDTATMAEAAADFAEWAHSEGWRVRSKNMTCPDCFKPRTKKVTRTKKATR